MDPIRPTSWKPVICATAAAAVVLAASPRVSAQEEGDGAFEAAPVFVAKEALPEALVATPHYRVDGYVYNDGINNKYQVTSDLGQLTVETTDLLLTRIDEMSAARRLDRIIASKVCAEAADAAGRGPLAGVKPLLARSLDGGATTEVKSFLAPSEPVPLRPPPGKEEAFLAAMTTFDAAKRRAAFAVGVDPYSDFAPLQQRLGDLAWAMIAGGLTIESAFEAIGEKPAEGGGRLGDEVARWVRDHPRGELKRMSRDRLMAMGVNESVARVLVDHPRYSPTMVARVVVALEAMKGVDGRHILVEAAALAQDSTAVRNLVRRAELIAGYHAEVAPVARMLRLGSGFFLQKDDGTIVGVFAGDYVVWSRAVAHAETAVSRSISELPARGAGRELWFSRRVSPTARAQLEARGWRVYESSHERLVLG